MVKLIKWNCIDFFKRHYWIILTMGASLILAAIPENGSGVLNTSLILTAALLAFISFLAGIFYAILQSIRWLERDSMLMDLSLPFPISKILFAKFFIAGIINTISLLFMLQFFVLTLKYSTGVIRLISIDELRAIPLLIVLLLLLDSTFLISYLISRSVSKNNRFAWLIATGLSFMIFLLITIGLVWTMKEAGMVSLPVITSENILSINGSLNFQSTWLMGCLSILVISMEHTISSTLIQNRYQSY